MCRTCKCQSHETWPHTASNSYYVLFRQRLCQPLSKSKVVSRWGLGCRDKASSKHRHLQRRLFAVICRERKSPRFPRPIRLIYRAIAATYHSRGDGPWRPPNPHASKDICAGPSSLELGGRLIGLPSPISWRDGCSLDWVAKCLFKCRARTGIVLGWRCLL